MRLKIPYSEVADLTLREVASYVRNEGLPQLKQITLQDLADYERDLGKKKLIHYNPWDMFGRGVYIFFDGQMAKYVGKTNHDFLARMVQQLSPVQHGQWGWNAFLRYVSSEQAGGIPHDKLTKADFLKGREVAQAYRLALIPITHHDGDGKWLGELERFFQRIYKAENPQPEDGKTGLAHNRVRTLRENELTWELGKHMDWWTRNRRKG